MKKILSLFLMLVTLVVSSQPSKIDSLLTLLKKDKEDTNKVNHLNILSREYINISNYDSSITFANAGLQLSQQLNPQYKKGIAFAYNNLGIISKEQSDYPKAIDYYLKGIRIDEELENKKGIAGKLINIGVVYELNGDYSKALDYYFKGLKITEEMGYKKYQANALSNIGIVFARQNDSPKARKYYFKALKLSEELGDKNGIAYKFVQIGSSYHREKDYPKALDYYFKAMQQAEEFGDKILITSSLANIGEVYTETKKYVEAEKYLSNAMRLAQELGAQDYKRQIEESFSNLYSKTNRLQLALEHYKKAMALKDTLFNQEKNKELTRKEMNYEFEKKEAIAKAEQDKKDVMATEEKRRQKMFLFSVIGGLLLVVVFSIFMFNRWRVTQRQKAIIEKQKHIVDEQKKLVEEKNKDITDSINYAQRIQKALLASDSLLNKNLVEHFVFFKPKDIVSGDFYWATEKDGRFYLAVCDSTGHGVPGAFMSLLNISFLNEAITEKGIIQPNEIFNHVRQRLIENLSSEGRQDGMDGILVCFEKLPSPMGEGSGVRLTYAGANNAPYLMNASLQELDTDSMPVGLGEKKDSFTHHTISFQSGNILYLYTDGFADQFGGLKGKKFKYKQLNEKLLAISDKSLAEQKDILEKTFEDWRGSLEQVDDVLIIGIKV